MAVVDLFVVLCATAHGECQIGTLNPPDEPFYSVEECEAVVTELDPQSRFEAEFAGEDYDVFFAVDCVKRGGDRT
jgi:hypothetical protein